MPQIKINVRQKDMWLIEEIKRTVTVKSQLGIDTSLGFEIARELHRAFNPERVKELEDKAKARGIEITKKE